MHLIVAIALGVFGGLWLFVRWTEWREVRRQPTLQLYFPKPPRQPFLTETRLAFILKSGAAFTFVWFVVAFYNASQYVGPSLPH
jgi:hypothetical protein